MRAITLTVFCIITGCTTVTTGKSDGLPRTIDMDSSIGQSRIIFQQNFLYRKGEQIWLKGRIDGDHGAQGVTGKIVPCEGARDAAEFIPNNGPELSKENEKRLIEAMNAGEFGWAVSYQYRTHKGSDYIASEPTKLRKAKAPIERIAASELDGMCLAFWAEITHEIEITSTSIVSSVDILNVYD